MNGGTSSLGLKKEENVSGAAAVSSNCLDALWSVISQWESLLTESPYAIAKALQVIAALWQAGTPVLGAINSLQQRSDFWAAVIGILKSGAKERSLEAPSEGDDDAPSKWAALSPSCWKIAAEEAALKILTAECFTWRGVSGAKNNINNTNKGASSTITSVTPAAVHDMHAEVSNFASHGLYDVLPSLMERYCIVLPTEGLQKDTRRLAAATAAQILEATLIDQTLWPSARTGVSLVSQLYALVVTQSEPNAQVYQQMSTEQIAAAVSELGGEVLGPKGDDVIETRAVVQFLADGLLVQAEVPPRLAASAEYGPSYIYDSLMLGRRVGVALTQEAHLVNDLQTWVGAVSIAAGLEHARMEAAAALDALATVADAVGQRRKKITGGSTTTTMTATKKVVNPNEAPTIMTGQRELQALSALDIVIDGVVKCVIDAQTRDRKIPGVSSDRSSSATSLHVPAAGVAAQVALIAVRSRDDTAMIGLEVAYTSAGRALSFAGKWIDAVTMLGML